MLHEAGFVAGGCHRLGMSSKGHNAVMHAEAAAEMANGHCRCWSHLFLHQRCQLLALLKLLHQRQQHLEPRLVVESAVNSNSVNKLQAPNRDMDQSNEGWYGAC